MAAPFELAIGSAGSKTNSVVICSPALGYYPNSMADQCKLELKFTLMKQNQFYYV